MSNFDFIGAIVEIVLWVIDYFRGITKKKQDDAARDHDKKLEARPKWLLKGFPFVIVENSDKHYFKKVYLYIIAESDDGKLKVNSTKDIQFPGKYSDTEEAYYIYPKDDATVNSIESKGEIALNFDGLKLKKGIKFRALILKAKTDVEEVTYYLYDYHDKECFISKGDPRYRKYFDAIANANLKYQSDDLEITTTTTTTTTLAPGYDY
ncbi:hypothetical protein NE287_10130 [Pediococcus pentosaceus]|uniref:hypothetical protein n=1 Tax=Pediococcus pentosaceus TaxID=1255 RepID=UPI00207375E9|nr:hypothetical protein [Pediococcus pentosaceus]MCM6811098.1 hypothetical protein [Pediococcus pentosaceus]